MIMKNKRMLILEYARLATYQVVQDGHILEKRMSEISDLLKMTHEAIMKEATSLAIASLK